MFGAYVHTSSVWSVRTYIQCLEHMYIHPVFGAYVHTSSVWSVRTYIQYLERTYIHPVFGAYIHTSSVWSVHTYIQCLERTYIHPVFGAYIHTSSVWSVRTYIQCLERTVYDFFCEPCWSLHLWQLIRQFHTQKKGEGGPRMADPFTTSHASLPGLYCCFWTQYLRHQYLLENTLSVEGTYTNENTEPFTHEKGVVSGCLFFCCKFVVDRVL